MTTAAMFVRNTADSAATAAAVLLVGTLVQSPIPNTLAGGGVVNEGAWSVNVVMYVHHHTVLCLK